MRKYFYSVTGRKLRKHEFDLERDTRGDKRYYTSVSSPFRYYTEPRNDIREKWIGREWDGDYNDTDRKLFAYLKRCYTLGMLIVNDVDLRSAYSCLRANPSSHWASKIKELLGNVLELGCRGADETYGEFVGAKTILHYLKEEHPELKEEQHEPKVINPSPVIIWRDETKDIYWKPHQHDDWDWHEQFQDYLDRELLDKEFRKMEATRIRENKQARLRANPITSTIDRFMTIE